MNREHLYQQRQSAGRMEMVMLVLAGIAFMGAVLAVLSHGWLPSLELLILGFVALALSRIFDLIGNLFSLVRWPIEGTTPPTRTAADLEGQHPKG